MASQPFSQSYISPGSPGTALYCSALQWSALQCTSMENILMRWIAQYCIALYKTNLHCITLQYTVFHCNTMHSTVLQCTVPQKKTTGCGAVMTWIVSNYPTLHCPPSVTGTSWSGDFWAKSVVKYVELRTPFFRGSMAVWGFEFFQVLGPVLVNHSTVHSAGVTRGGGLWRLALVSKGYGFFKKILMHH